MSNEKMYEPHIIANTFPMMGEKAFNNLVMNMIKNGFDETQPIILYDNQILDGRNRYKASLEANIEPKFTTFEGTFEEAVEKSRQLNSTRRQLSSSQLAMIAAKEVLASRNNPEMKKIPIEKASKLYCSSLTYAKMALRILETDKDLAENVFNGSLNIKEAVYRIEQIQALREIPNDNYEYIVSDESTEELSNESTQENMLIAEFSQNGKLAAQRVIDIQDKYKELLKINEQLQEQLKNCTCKKK